MLLYNFDLARNWYDKALAIHIKYDQTDKIGVIFHQLGMIEEKEENYDKAEEFYKNSLTIKEQFLDNHGIASVCGRLGTMSQSTKDYEAAALWYMKSAINYSYTSDTRALSEVLKDYHYVLTFIDDARVSNIKKMYFEAQLNQVEEQLVYNM